MHLRPLLSTLVPVTVGSFDPIARYLGEYMQSFYKIDDIPLRQIGLEFITNFEYYLRTVKAVGIMLS